MASVSSLSVPARFESENLHCYRIACFDSIIKAAFVHSPFPQIDESMNYK